MPPDRKTTSTPVPLAGSKTLLMGGPGTGKTYSLATWLLDPYIEHLAVLFTERDGPKSLLKAAHELGVDRSRLHYHVVSPRVAGFANQLTLARTIQGLTYEGMTQRKAALPGTDNSQLLQLLEALMDFPDDLTGERLGDVSTWPNTWVFALDGLSGTTTMALDLVCGIKPARFEGEYGIAQEQQRQLVSTIVESTQCFVVVVCHEQRVQNAVSLEVNVYPNAVGNKYGPDVAVPFSDFVKAKHGKGNSFRWSTQEDGHDLKARLLPINPSIDPSFTQIIEAWKKSVDYITTHETIEKDISDAAVTV